jgi:hypothetical protein
MRSMTVGVLVAASWYRQHCLPDRRNPAVGTGLRRSAVVSHRSQRTSARRLAIYLAALWSIGAIIATVVAVPIMQGIDSLGNDSAALQSAFGVCPLLRFSVIPAAPAGRAANSGSTSGAES